MTQKKRSFARAIVLILALAIALPVWADDAVGSGAWQAVVDFVQSVLQGGDAAGGDPGADSEYSPQMPVGG